MWSAPRATRTVHETGQARDRVAIPPLGRRLARDVHCLSCLGDGETVAFDALAEPASTLNGERGVTVHWSLQGVWFLDSSTLPLGVHFMRGSASTRSVGRTPSGHLGDTEPVLGHGQDRCRRRDW